MNLGNANYQPSYMRHSRYHGYWTGNYGWGRGYRGIGAGFGRGYGYWPGYGYGGGWGYGGYGWGSPFGFFGYRPLGWGLGAWGLGSLAYGSGYLGYYNPYYGGYGGGIYNYAQPISVSYSAPVDQSAATDCQQTFDSAVDAFQRGDYDPALNLVDNGVVHCPDDAVMHEFRALVLFAKGDYRQAAAVIHSILAVGPGWDWTTLSGFYPDVSVYTHQLRALESYAGANPQDGASRFLLAYHYLVEGYQDAAATELKQVVQLVPNDKVAADLLKMVQPEGTSASPQPPAAEPPAGSPSSSQNTPSPDGGPATGPPVDPAQLVGTWHAARNDGSQFQLTLTQDGKFTWKFTLNGKTEEFGGHYTLDGNVVALERDGGGSLVAGIIFQGEKKFNFKLLGGPPEDPGLDFAS